METGQETIEVGINRLDDFDARNMKSIKNAKLSGDVVRLSRTGKGNAAENRDEIPTKQRKAINEFYKSLQDVLA